MKAQGWTILFHECLIEQVQPLRFAAERAEQRKPVGLGENSTVKLYRHLTDIMFGVVPLNGAGLSALAAGKNWAAVSAVFSLRLGLEANRLCVGEWWADSTFCGEQVWPVFGFFKNAEPWVSARRLGRACPDESRWVGL